MQTKHDPETHARMRIPHASQAEARAALEFFFADVEKARLEHRIAEVVVIAEALDPNDRVCGGCVSTLRLGSSLRSLELAAVLYGSVKRELDTHLAELAKSGELVKP